ncbi:MAG: M20/M25/M40 family metallo-hydrolase [Coprococcus sp.]
MKIETFVREHFEAYKELICRITSIPAPSHKEDARATFICDYLHQLGYLQAFTDEAKNVICEIKGRDSRKDVHIFMAHTDTVFPDETTIPVIIEDGCIKAPGVGDDTTNVCAILMTLQYLTENPMIPEQDTIFVLNSCEEGLGNLKGCRALVRRYEGRLGQVVSFDCGYTDGTVWAVGSRRYAINVRTAGGHSYADFGAVNAIAAAADIIHDFYQVDTKTMPGKTTYNVGIIEGGTSVNTIAQNVEFMYEYRSDRMEGLELMEKKMKDILAGYTDRTDVDVQVKIIGDRPSMGNVDKIKMAELQKKASDIITKNTGIIPVFGSGSTDCNIPLSMGIPAICFGSYIGGGQHTREEYVRIDSLEGGLRCVMNMVVQDMS